MNLDTALGDGVDSIRDAPKDIIKTTNGNLIWVAGNYRVSKYPIDL
jgi:hypothetical protein